MGQGRLGPSALRVAAATLLVSGMAPLGAQTFDEGAVRVPMTPEVWTSAADTMAFGEFWGREALYIGTGKAFSSGFEMRDGVIEFDLGAPEGTSFMGLGFRVQSQDAYEMVFFRPFASGTSEAIQYQPSLMGSGTWQLFHGPANGVASFARNRWVPIRIELAGSTARVFVDGAASPQLEIADLALGAESGGLAFWTGTFGQGGYLSNVRFTPSDEAVAAVERPAYREGTISSWELSPAYEGGELESGSLPDGLNGGSWEAVAAEPWPMRQGDLPGIVWLNRYRRSPDRGTGGASMFNGVEGTSTVFARTTIIAGEEGLRRLHFGYTDSVEIFLNGEPIYLGANPLGMRALRGVMEQGGEAIYLPLREGENELVFAVTEYFGGWGFWGLLEPEQ